MKDDVKMIKVSIDKTRRSNDGNNTASELTDYLRYESSTNDNNGSSQSEIIRRHALEQLIESRLGAAVTAAARRLIADDSSSRRRHPTAEEDWRNAADELMETSSFRLLQTAVEECASRLPASATSSADAGDEHADVVACEKAKIPDAPAAAAAAAPTSFSLFDMLDARKGGFALPPRITARQIIEMHRHEKNAGVAGAAAAATTSGNGEESTTLELLEKAEDMEDLSPDPDAWEEIRKILYDGLSLSNSNGPDDASSRYLKVHVSLLDKCRGDDAFTSQIWGLAQNLVGSILTFSRHFGENNELTDASRRSMDLCWDISQSFLVVLSPLALDHVVSCVGNEREIERMFLGMCAILSDNFSACVVGMMESMAGQFEVWARLVCPGRLMTIIRASGLGGVALRRCESLGKDASSEGIWNMLQASGNGAQASSTSLADIEHCNFLQSLSTLRTILFQCGGSREVVSMIHNQLIGEPQGPTVLSSFLSPYGVASPDDVQTLLKQVEEKHKQRNQTQHPSVHDEISSVLKPFLGVIQVKETDAGMVDSDLEVLCLQTIQLIQQS